MRTGHNRYCIKTFGINSTLIICLLSLFSISTHAQKSEIGTWKTYMAYQNATHLAETSSLVFAVYDGSLLSYSPEDEEIMTYSFRDGLNDVGIVQMGYSPEAKALVLVYENANIDLFYGRNNVVNISSIKDKTSLMDKTINSLEIIGKQAYISTGFGIVEVNLGRNEVKNQFRSGESTWSVCQWGDYFYAATNTGIKKGLTSSNLADPENWQSVNLSNYGGNDKRITKMTVFKDQLVFYDSSNTNVYYLTKEGTIKLLLDDSCQQLIVLNEQLIVCASSNIYFFTDFEKQTKIQVAANSISSYNSKNTYWIAQSNNGLTGIKKETNTIEYSVIKSGISVNSPLRNSCFYMTYTADKLLVVGGSNALGASNPGTFMIYENNKWTNFDDQAIARASGLKYYDTPWCRNFVSVAVDPRDPKHYFVASFSGGVYEFQDTTFVKLHTHTNTNNALQVAVPISPENANRGVYVRASGMAFDKNNNLYITNTEAQNGLSILTNDNKWEPFFYSDISGKWLSQILITRNNQKWINKYRASTGIFVLDDKNTINNTSDDQLYHSVTFVDQKDKDINASAYLCMAEDLGGTVWVGTNNGPISFSSANQVNQGVCNRIISTDQFGDGYYPLEGETVTAIAVDGGNRKWMGTQSGGVYIVDNTKGELNVENFKTSNSLLISDNITSIAINNKTGEVFIGTDKGLVSYMSDAIEGMPDYSEVYAYPNPVRPEDNSQVVIKGLISNSNVKIADLAGNIMKQGSSNGGQYTWNCTNQTGAIVKAGIYLVFAALPDGSQGVVAKIMVIK